MRHIVGALLLLAPTAAAAAGPGHAILGDSLLVIGGLAVAALIGRRRRGLPERCD